MVLRFGKLPKKLLRNFVSIIWNSIIVCITYISEIFLESKMVISFGEFNMILNNLRSLR